MFNSNSNHLSVLKIGVSAICVAALTFSPCALAHEHEGKDKLNAGSDKEVTGEIVDLMCYIDHAATGDKHAACGTKCIKNGGPVGIVSNGKAYLVVGEHKPINAELADSCGKTITLKGKMAERDGMTMLENAEIVKK